MTWRPTRCRPHLLQKANEIHAISCPILTQTRTLPFTPLYSCQIQLVYSMREVQLYMSMTIQPILIRETRFNGALALTALEVESLFPPAGLRTVVVDCLPEQVSAPCFRYGGIVQYNRWSIVLLRNELELWTRARSNHPRDAPSTSASRQATQLLPHKYNICGWRSAQCRSPFIEF
jgi:hypothetical protein